MLKKVLALFITLTMVFSMGSVAAFAADGDVGGSGDTTYVKTDVMAMVLPTANNWDFYLDPQGLIGAHKAGLFSTASSGVTQAQLAPFAGKIIAGDYAPIAINKSSYKMTLGVEIKVIGDAITVADVDDLEADDENNILLEAVFSKDSVASSGVTFTPASPGVTEPLDDVGKTLGFVLDSPEYVFTTADGINFSYTLGSGQTGFGTQIQVGGLVNRNADWTDFSGDSATKEVSLEARFTLTKSSDEELGETPDPNAYGYIGLLGDPTPPPPPTPTEIGFIDGPGLTVIDDTSGMPPYTAPALQQASITTSAGPGAVIPFFLDGETVDVFAWYNDGNGIVSLEGAYTSDDDGFVADFTGWPVGGPYDIWIQLGNGDWYILWVTIE